MIRYYIADIKTLPDPMANPKEIMDLPRERQEKCLWYVRAEDRKRCLGAGKIIERILSDFNACDSLCYERNGKPKCEKVFFNVSHSGRYVVGVASNVQIGCDIEQEINAPLEVARQYFYHSELEYIQNNSDKSTAFWKLWTLKESYMKMTGEGMSLPLDSFEVKLDVEISVYRKGIKQECSLKSFCCNGHRISLCVGTKDFEFAEDISWIKIS